MKIKEMLPLKVLRKEENYQDISNNILNSNLFCLESFSSYIERHIHKENINKRQAFNIFYETPSIMLNEFTREIVRNYLLLNGTVFLDVYKALSIKDKQIKEELFSNYKKNKYYTIYFNSIVGRIYTNYQSWNKVNNLHLLHYLSKEKLFSLDVKSCNLTVYLNLLKNYGEDVEELLNFLYQENVDLYVYFFVRTFMSNIIEEYGYNELIIYSYFLERKQLFSNLVKMLGKEDIKEPTKEEVLRTIKEIGKSILIAYINQGSNSIIYEISKLLSIKKNVLDYRVINSPFKIGVWNRILFNLQKNLDKFTVLTNFYSLPIPNFPEYFKSSSRLSAYILENIASYSIFNSLINLILKEIPIRGYFFDKVLIPNDRIHLKESLKECFMKNGLVPLKVKIKGRS
jgi:hypothetical protein